MNVPGTPAASHSSNAQMSASTTAPRATPSTSLARPLPKYLRQKQGNSPAAVLEALTPQLNAARKRTQASSTVPFAPPTKRRKRVDEAPRLKPLTEEPLPEVEACTAEEWLELMRVGVPEEFVVMPNQYQVELANGVTADRKDGLLFAPTGSGKSLVWLLALLRYNIGHIIVVVPLIDLGREQADNLNRMGISSIFIGGDDYQNINCEEIRYGYYRAVFVSAEKLSGPAFAEVIRDRHFLLSLIGVFIDEVHVVYDWRKFRPLYQTLGYLRPVIGYDKPFVCMTATCDPEARDFIVLTLGLRRDHLIYINLGNYRPELSLAIKEMEHDQSSLLDLGFLVPLGAVRNDILKTVVFCHDITKLTNILYFFRERLERSGLPEELADIYHADMTDTHRREVRERFHDGTTSILAATSAFGLGFHEPGICRIVQFLVDGLDGRALLQELGRALRGPGDNMMEMLGLLLVEKSMMKDGVITCKRPDLQDACLMKLLRGKGCMLHTIDKHFQNPPHPMATRACCSRCFPDIIPAREFRWLADQTATSISVPRIKKEVQERIVEALKVWRKEEWKKTWRKNSAFIGPLTYVADADLEMLAKRATVINSAADIIMFTKLPYPAIVAPGLLAALQEAKRAESLTNVVPSPAEVAPPQNVPAYSGDASRREERRALAQIQGENTPDNVSRRGRGQARAGKTKEPTPYAQHMHVFTVF